MPDRLDTPHEPAGTGPPVPALEIRRYLVGLRLTRPAAFHFVHGGALRGLLSAALGRHELPQGVVPHGCEMGRVRYERGDGYRFGLTLVGAAGALAGDLAGDLAAGLARLGAERPARGAPPATLHGNFRLEAFEALPPPDLAAEAHALAGRERLAVRLLSPLRLRRPPELVRKGGAYLDARCFPAAAFLDGVARRIRFFLGEPEVAPPGEAPPVEIHASDLLWIDMPIPGDSRKDRPMTLGGVLGTVTLGAPPPAWLEALVLGQHLHAGSATRYGLGRFRFAELGPDPYRPAETLLARAARPATLRAAADHVTAERDADAPSLPAVADDALNALAGELLAGTYVTPQLEGVLLPKPSGGVRALAVPPVRDRVAQRAACEILSPAIDTLLEESSFAYRKGFSRHGAARAIQRAAEEGFRWVLDADIVSFFDAVDWRRLFAKLDALFPGEPLVVLLRRWVQAPVRFEGRLVARERGLPQGSPVAPLLANLYLDELDEELLGKEYRLVRYADDFVVLCRDLDAARAAQAEAAAALARLGLELHPDKTRITDLHSGLTYLGFLFCRSLALETRRDTEGPGAPPRPVTPEDIPAMSWLASVPFAAVREVAGRRAGGRTPEPVPLATPAPGAPRKVPLFLTDPGAEVRMRGESLVVRTEEGPPRSVPLRGLSHLVVFGRPRVSVALLLGLAARGIPAYFCSRSGAPVATFGAAGGEWETWLDQARAAGEPARRVAFAREVVAAKLHNSATLLVRFGWDEAPVAARELRDLERDCANQTTLDALRGLEGRGAARYFASLAATLPAGWRFPGRRRRPPPDAVNAMLSLGYTLLHHEAARALLAAGLHPRIGLLHRAHGAHQALASDLQEEFRHLVDALVWTLVQRGQAKPADFARGEEEGGACVASLAVRRKLFAAFGRRLDGEVTPEGGERASYRAHIAAQAGRIADFARGRTATYRPFRLHA